MDSNWVLLGFTLYVLSWLIPLLMLFVVPVNRPPGTAMAWLLFIFLFPFVGLVLYLLIGLPTLSARRREQQQTMTHAFQQVAQAVQARPDLCEAYNPPLAPRYAPFVRLSQTLTGLPAVGGNCVELLPDYDGAFARIAADIDRAQTFVHIAYYCFSRSAPTEPVFQALERARQRGVTVRALYDHVGSLVFPGFRRMRAELTAAGIEHHPMLPLRFFRSDYTRPDMRNHRKLVVVDGVVGYLGSQNLIQDDYFRRGKMRYIELGARLTGPIVAELQAVFNSDWYAETGERLTFAAYPELAVLPAPTGDVLCQVLPSGASYDRPNNLKLFTGLIHAAQRRVCIVNPYFVPDDSLLLALTNAAQRGVEVILLNSAMADQFFQYHAERSYYDQILNAGVNIWLYPAPQIMHSKFMTIDDDIGVIGSSNMDMRSFYLNLEISLLCYDRAVVAAMCGVQHEYLRVSSPLQRDAWRKRGFAVRLCENFARLTAELQ
jgi:cardiolipin synthase A/B